MVKKNENKINQDDIEFTSDETEHSIEPDIEEVENSEQNKIKELREKLKNSEVERLDMLEELQRTKAEFLNAKKRLEEERVRDRERNNMNFVEGLIPLADSFQMAMSNATTWEKADPSWRKGVEGIYSQLESIFAKHKVSFLKPLGEQFNPHQHEAINMIPVDDENKHDKVVAVIQSGYEITHSNGNTELIRPARVTIGVFEQKK